MKKYMTILFIMVIFCIVHLVVGMDSLSDYSESMDREPTELKDYTKKEPKFDDLNDYIKKNAYSRQELSNDSTLETYGTKENSDGKELPKESGENLYKYNKLKRKHQPEKLCEFCGQRSTNGRLIKSRLTHYGLCEACYVYERRHQKLIPLNERKIHKNKITCEFCKKESKILRKGKNGDKSLCHGCYDYERRYGQLIPLDQRKHYEKHKDRILVCEFCQKESKIYKKGKVCGKSLCDPCYVYELRHGHLVPQSERKKSAKYKNHILVCEFCQEESINYKKGRVSGWYLCQPCYDCERRYGYIIPVDKRNIYQKRK